MKVGKLNSGWLSGNPGRIVVATIEAVVARGHEVRAIHTGERIRRWLGGSDVSITAELSR